MTHLLPPHANLDLSQSSLQSALQIDPNQPGMQAQQAQQQDVPPARKRKKTDGQEAPSPAEPRRLRRSHEACARCRSKKIKASPCDSKHPRCTACATAGVPCQQEDRHRQTLTPRGHTERIERQLAQCDALLKRRVPGFDLSNLDEICAREGIQVDGVAPPSIMSPNFQFMEAGPSRSPYPPPPAPTVAPAGSASQAPKGYPYPQPQPIVTSGYAVPVYPGGPPGSPYPPPHMAMQSAPPGGFNPHIHPSFQHQQPSQAVPAPPHTPPQNAPVRSTTSSVENIKGGDPLANDMSNTQALAKSFGVSAAIVNDLKLNPSIGVADLKEDLAVGAAGLTSGRDRDIVESSVPRDTAKWVSVPVRRNSVIAMSPSSTASASASNNVPVWLPKDRNMVKHIVDVYFTRLNPHRPVFLRQDFEQTLNALYDRQAVQHDPGYISGLYLMLALGTLSELSHKVCDLDKDGRGSAGPTIKKKLMPQDWPEPEEFFERSLVVKPDLRVSVSSLQALILLHWYLFSEGQGRTLWRLVGSMIRLAIELGLHHDPITQYQTFTEEEAQLRICLWATVIIHDRGTSLMLGRPLAIAPSDSNTPRPSRGRTLSDASEHFVLSGPIAEIQADIINSLYSPTRQSAPDAIIRHATRIIKSMFEFRKQLPESYQWYFCGTDDWPTERRVKLVQDITEDVGLTLLKVGITRILLLRALFSSKELDYQQRYKALVDAIVTSHNIVVVHNQLIRFPDIAFFVSPIPLHIAAMVILYGHMSKCERLTRQVALEDVWMALDMLPRFRWRWERKDMTSGHPLIAKLAEKVLDVNLHQVGPPSHPVLLSEQDWESDAGMLSPALSSSGSVHGSQSQHTPSKATPTTYSGPGYAPPTGSNGGSHSHTPPGKAGPGTPPDKKQLADMNPGLFYPFYPDPNQQGMVNNGRSHNGNGNGDVNELLAAASAAVQPIGAYGCPPSQESYMLEEKDGSSLNQGGQMWMNMVR
ncbi:hypothetical protein NEOLEDRAFT_1056054 [Neolentinus lepideus HHB14362 ss-1]|uniref:Zn(2)-C6 fungal-type domain-containing protein n=1 Tax=Neolentinus lepideus HHB14362 ss-1 TaxID=1314782 RepID=A0A165VNG8_9AGAM|nr:hypothetical protein NEOLEDRAFT_1056054 [Neolentinus lepideus HHB14362 ss-1]